MRNIIFKLILVGNLLLATGLCACGSYGPWEVEEDLEGPWVGPSQHVIQECRWNNPGFMIIADPKYRCRQLGVDRKRLDYDKQARKIERFILDNDISGFEIDRSVDRNEILSGGRTLWVPSIDPLVVFVMPKAVPPLTVPYEYIGKVHANVYFSHSTVLTEFEYWFSPDLSVEPTDLSFVQGRAEIHLFPDRLRLTETPKGIVTTRVSDIGASSAVPQLWGARPFNHVVASPGLLTSPQEG